MILRKISGKTLNEARNQAVEKYGNQFVIVETSDGTQSESAFITIAIESENSKPSQNNSDGEKSSPSIVKPLLNHVEKLFESGIENFSSLKNISPSSYLHSGSTNKKQQNQKNRNNSTPGVSYIKSKPEHPPANRQQVKSKTPDENKKVPQTSDTGSSGFREHFKKKPDRQSNNGRDKQITKLNRRLEILEKMVWKFADDQSEYSEIPLYRYLRKLHFKPEILLDWFEDNVPVNGLNHTKISLSEQNVPSIIEDYFDSRDPLTESKRHLFTSFPGVNISKIVSAIADHCRMKGNKFEVGIIFSDSFESDDQSIQLMDSFKTLNATCHDIVTNRDWQTLLNHTDDETFLFLVTLPLQFDLKKVGSGWSHFNRILGEYHSVKHHFISHSLHNPTEIIKMLPLDHAFRPDYITLTNLEMCQYNYGKLTDYKEKSGFDFGFFHKAGKPLTEPYGRIEQKLSPLVLQEFEKPVVREIKQQKFAKAL